MLPFPRKFVFTTVLISIAMMKDDSAVVFGEDVAFGGVFRCTMVNPLFWSEISLTTK